MISLPREYFIEQLTRLCDGELDEIIRSRATALGVSDTSVEDRSRWKGYENGQLLAEIRKSFWEAPTSETLKKLDAIDVDTYPEYASSVERLRRACDACDEWQVAESRMRRRHGDFLYYFKLTANCTPQKRADIKQTIFEYGLRFPKGYRYRSAAKLIRKNFPKICAVDPVWIEHICIETRIGKSWRVVYWQVWVIAIFILFILFISLIADLK